MRPGSRHTDEAKARIGAAMRGRELSEDHKRKLALAQRRSRERREAEVRDPELARRAAEKRDGLHAPHHRVLPDPDRRLRAEVARRTRELEELRRAGAVRDPRCARIEGSLALAERDLRDSLETAWEQISARIAANGHRPSGAYTAEEIGAMLTEQRRPEPKPRPVEPDPRRPYAAKWTPNYKMIDD
jgi:hypothetical protein